MPKDDKTRRRSSRSQAQRRRYPERESAKPTPTADPQSKCPFFRTERGLPREIRDIIFKLALISYEDSSRPRSVDTFKADAVGVHSHDYARYRPGHLCTRRTDTALLQTCRAIYQETRLLPVAINVHPLWYRHFRSSSHSRATVASIYFKGMRPEQLAAVHHVQVFGEVSLLLAQEAEGQAQFVTHGILAELCMLRGRCSPEWKFDNSMWRDGRWCPRMITITVRQMDWRNEWEYEHSGLDYMLQARHWEVVFGGLKVLKMELEVPKRKKAWVGTVVEKLVDFRFDIGDGEELVAEQKLEESTWTGPIDMNCFDGHTTWGDLEFLVVTVVWKVRQVDETESVADNAPSSSNSQ